MNYATIKKTDVANGPGIRVSLFVSGCTHACKGCFNSEAWDFNYGTPFTEKTENYILSLLENSYISGLSILGGEPMEIQNQRALLPLLKKVKKNFPQKDIWCYSGYLFDTEIKKGRAHCEVTDEILKCIDVLVDGRFVEEKKNIMLKFRGSENQRIIDVKKSLENNEIVLKKEFQ